jgi:uncharacterized protein
MAVELRPFGVACNIACRYCYQNPQRDAGNVRQSYDLERMFAAVEKEGGPLTLFGGEPLLLPVLDLERIFRWGFGKYGRNGLQTNGVLIGDEHVRMFREYNVDVGVSIDGPGELNDLRWNRTLDRTRQDTATVERNIARLCREHRPPGLIITLHRGNAAAKHLPRMCDWLRSLDALGIQSVRLHALEIDSAAMRAWALSDEENARAFLAFAELQPQLRTLRLDTFDELERGLLGHDSRTGCVWRSCDPYTTEAVRGVEGNGQLSNCGRTNKDGVDFIKADRAGFERYLALYHTPQGEGGCKGCRFFLMCRGQCPGTAVDGDWRNRSELCGLWKRLFIATEKALILRNETPLSILPVRHRLERQLLARWRSGRNVPTQNLSWADDAPQHRDGTYTFPPFVRCAWAGKAQREVWESRLASIEAARPRFAIAAVADRVVAASLVRIVPAMVIRLHNEAAAQRLHTRMLDRRSDGRECTVVIGTERAVARVVDAWRSSDATALDEALTLPECCRAAAVEVRREQTDPVWRAAGAPPSLTAEIANNPATNVLLGQLGIDVLGYIPCSFQCAASIRRGEALLESARRTGLEAAEWLAAILSWPVEWSSLHGIAEIKTGVVKIIHHTRYTAAKRIILYHGSALPADAATGLSFAFREPKRRAAAAMQESR